jgi:hypothetical protein
MEEYGFNKEEVNSSVLANRHNHVTTTYYLLLKNKVKRGLSSIADVASKEFNDYIKIPENKLAFYNNDIESVIRHRGRIEKRNSEIKDISHLKLDLKDSEQNFKRLDTMTTTNNTNSKLSGLTNVEEKPVKMSKKVTTESNRRSLNSSLNNSYLNTEVVDKIHYEIKKLPNIAYNLKADEDKNTKDRFKKIPIMQYTTDRPSTVIKKKRHINDFKSNFVNTSNSFDTNADMKNITIDQGMLKKIELEKANKSHRINLKIGVDKMYKYYNFSKLAKDKKDPFPSVNETNKSMIQNFDVIKEEDELKIIKKCSPKKIHTSQSPKKVINDMLFNRDKNISPIRPSVTPNSAIVKKDYRNKLSNVSDLTSKYNSTFNNISSIRPFTGIMNAKKIVKKHMNKMLATLNESMGLDEKKNSKFDGKYLANIELKMHNGPIDLNCLLFKPPKKIKQDLIKLLTHNKVLFKISYVSLLIYLVLFL